VSSGRPIRSSDRFPTTGHFSSNEVNMKRTLIAAAVVLAAFPALARAHAGDNGANIVHACVGNISKVARIVGVGGTCISGPPLIAETAMHWPLTSGAAQTQLDTLQALVTTLQGQIAALQAGLPAETAARQAADVTLQTHIDAEAAARATADIGLQTQIDNLGGGGVPQSLLDLAPYVSVDLNTINDLTGPHVIFTGANVHVRNALGATNGYPVNPGATNPVDMVTDGLGNLIVGYNENPSGFPRSGSHNLLVGIAHGFTGFGGFLAGRYNRSLGNLASVTGGFFNTASGEAAVVSGGANNRATVPHAVVSGGILNTASGIGASVSGGSQNTASAEFSSVSGGRNNVANNVFAAVSGGLINLASGVDATVSGGARNVASGTASTVSGGTGLTNDADGTEVP
jgi:hypothetical protein